MSKKEEKKNKTGMQRLEDYLASNWKQLLKDVFGLLIPPIIFIYISFLFGITTTVAKSEIATSLIQAEATIMGFFAIMVAYILNSLDDKENTYGEKMLDLEINMKDFEDYAEKRIDMNKNLDTSESLVTKTRGERLEELIREVQEKKKRIVSLSTWTGSYLLISILLSILVLGIASISWIAILSTFAVYFLLVSFTYILQMLRIFGSVRFQTFTFTEKK